MVSAMWSNVTLDIPISLRTTALSVAAMWLLSGCGLINSFQDPPEESTQNGDSDNDNDADLNACGGQDELQFEGSPAAPGDTCGPCDRDTLQCDGEEQLVCSPGGTPCEGASELATTPHVDHVLVEWNHVDGADAYRIYRDGEVIATVEADPDEGAQTYEDDGATAVVPEATDVEASQGARPDGIELTWTPIEDPDDTDPDDVPDGYRLTEHEYSLVAEHRDFESGDSEPVEVSGHRRADAIDFYEFRVVSDNDPEWIDASNQQVIDDQVFVVNSTDAGANTSELDFNALSATEGDVDDEIIIEISDVAALWTPTEYEFRAVTESGIEGDIATTSGRTSAEEFNVRWLRSDSESGNFDEIENSTVAVDEDADDQRYTPEGPVSTADTPGTSDAYYYRAELWIDDHDDDSVITDDDRGFMGYPPLYSASNDETVRRIHPVGEEAWEWDLDPLSGNDAILDVITTPDGPVYLSTQGGEIVKLSDDGSEQWTFDEHDEQVDDITVGPDEDYLYSASEDGTVYQLETDSGSIANQWTNDDYEHLSVAVGDTDAVYVASARAIPSADPGIVKLDFSGNEVDQLWKHETESDASAVAVDDDGYVYWGSVNQELERLTSSGDEDVSYQLPLASTAFVNDIAIDDQDRLYACGDDFNFDGFLWQYDVDQSAPIDTVDNLPTQVTGLDVAPDGHIYYSLGTENSVHKLDENLDEVWVFDEHDAVVQSVAIAPGVYGTFPAAWDDD